VQGGASRTRAVNVVHVGPQVAVRRNTLLCTLDACSLQIQAVSVGRSREGVGLSFSRSKAILTTGGTSGVPSRSHKKVGSESLPAIAEQHLGASSEDERPAQCYIYLEQAQFA
jgi:hypothetical protein